MTQLSGIRYPEVMDHMMDPPPEYYDIDNKQEKKQNMLDLDDKIRSTLYELEGAKHEISKAKSFNNNLDKKIDEATKDRDSLRQKIDSLKVKLGVSNANLNKCNDEKESLRSNLDEAQVLVARLEERLTAASSELDRMRDPANPESNMSIRKHVINDKKEIKKLKAEVENERNNLDQDIETSKAKDAEIKALEKELANTKDMLSVCEEERKEAIQEEEEEKRLKEEMVQGYKLLKADRKTYEQRLKEAKVKLGVKLSGKNVNVRVMDDVIKREKELSKQLNKIEKKLKEATGDLEILKNQHKMSKTAQSINKYTRRNQSSRGETGIISMAQSGVGPVQFASKGQKGQKEKGLTNRSSMSEPDRLRGKGNDTERSNNAGKGKGDDADRSSNAGKGKGGDTDRSSNAGKGKKGDTGRSSNAGKGNGGENATASNIPSKGILTQRRQSTVSKQPSFGKGEKRNSVQFVPPPKVKLQGNAT